MSDYVRRATEPDLLLLPRLGAMDIELTERCDNDCIHCCINLPAADAQAAARELTTEQWKEILRQAAELGCLQVRLTGGEPLLRPDFEELYLYARRLGLRVLIFTNARRVTARLAGLLARVPPLEPIEVTVYGMRAGSYEAVSRVPGSYGQFRRGLDLLLERGVPLVVKGALLPPNRAEIDELEAWARTLPSMGRPPAYVLFLDLRDRRDDAAKNRLIESLRLTPEEGLAVLTREEARYRREMTEFAARFLGPVGDALFRCGSGQGVSIDAYGRVQPCLGVRAPDLTVDVLELSLSEALERFAHLRRLRAVNPEYLRRCAVCFLKNLCAQCPAKSWAEHGTLDTPVEYLCAVTHVQARFLGWLQEDEHAWEVGERRGRVRRSVAVGSRSEAWRGPS